MQTLSLGAGRARCGEASLLCCWPSPIPSSAALEEEGSILVSQDEEKMLRLTRLSPLVSGKPGLIWTTCCPVRAGHETSSRALSAGRDSGPRVHPGTGE